MIPGAQYGLAAPGRDPNVVQVAGGSQVTLPVNGQVTIEVFSGPGTPPSAPAPGFQGLLVADGDRFELVHGAFAVADTGSTSDTIMADDDYQTIFGGSAPDLLIAKGDFDLVRSQGGDTINVSGSYDTVGIGPQGGALVGVFGFADLVAAGPGSDTIEVHGFGDTVQVQGNQLVELSGGGTSIVEGSGIYHDTIVGFAAGSDHVALPGDEAAGVAAQQTQGQGGTLVTLSDGSTILFKGISHVDNSFFH